MSKMAHKRPQTCNGAKMFKKNERHIQAKIFGISTILPQEYVKGIEESEEQAFYELVFCNIREESFACLYSQKYSRPNSPINCLVGAILLQHRNHWTVEQLFKNIGYNLLTKTALGLSTFDEMSFNEATFFNFQNRLNQHFVTTGNNLLEHVFDSLTKEQLKRLGIKTNIQRTDSFQAASNIRRYSRLQLLVEMLIRVHRVLSDEDKKTYDELFVPYVRKTSGQFIYRLKQGEMQKQLEAIGTVYRRIHSEIAPRYNEVEIFKIFERVFEEHFAVVEEKIIVKQTTELTSDSLQSPDDIDATYHKKRNVSYRGQSVNIVETCNPGNPVNLITDISVNANNTDDSIVLHERLETLKQKTPDIEEIHHDGAYGSEGNDTKCSKLSITEIQTAIRGKESAVDITIEQKEDSFCVSCPSQTVIAVKRRKRYRAEFSEEGCASCSSRERCNLIKARHGRRYYFSEEDYLRKKRARNIYDIPPERRALRANVEATVSEFKRKMDDDKLKVRGHFKTAIFAFAMGISINFGRVHRFLLSQREVEIRHACV